MLVDLRLALRSLARSRTFTLTAVLTLALGIGATTAIFSVVYGVLLKPLPYDAPDRLVSVVSEKDGARAPAWTSPADFEQWLQRARHFERLALYQDREHTVTGHRDPEVTAVGFVSEGFFTTLGTRPALGRGPVAAESDQPVAVLSHAFSRRWFAANPLGATVAIDGRAHTVIGVMPPAFEFPSKRVALWVPAASVPGAFDNRKFRGYELVGRLKEASTLDQARAEAQAITGTLRAGTGQKEGPRTTVIAIEERLLGDARRGLVLLFAIVGILLLVAAINVGSVQLSRAAVRQRDLAVRVALGAGRWRLARHLLAESVVLAAGGAAGGLLVAAVLTPALVLLVPPETPRLAEVAISGPVLAFTAAIAALSVLMVGLVPAWHAWRLAPAAMLSSNDASRRTPRAGTRFGLVTVETALSTIALVVALLAARSLAALLNVEPDRSSNDVLTLPLTLPPPAYANCYPDPACVARAASFVRDVRSRVAMIPGVRSVAVTTSLPPHQSLMSFEGRAKNPETGRDEPYVFNIVAVDGDYFRTLGITALRGRVFDETDRAGSRPVVIVSRDLARRRFGREDVIGERMPLPPTPATIVGVVDDVRYSGLDRPSGGAFYLPYAQAFNPALYLAARVSGLPHAVADRLREAVHAVDPLVPVGRPRTLRELRHASVAEPESRAILLGTLALLALLLASVGLYGNSAYTTAQRTMEVGVRMALGASGRSVFRLLAVSSLAPVAIGIVAGLGTAAALSRLLEGLLFGVRPLDPATFAGVPALLLAVAAVAVSLPALRAARVEPAVSLRRTDG